MNLQATAHTTYRDDVALYEPDDLNPGSDFMINYVPQGAAKNAQLRAECDAQLESWKQQCRRVALEARRIARHGDIGKRHTRKLTAWIRSGDAEAFTAWLKARRPRPDIIGHAAMVAYTKRGIAEAEAKSRSGNLRRMAQIEKFNPATWGKALTIMGCSEVAIRRFLAGQLRIADQETAPPCPCRPRDACAVPAPNEVQAALNVPAWRAIIEQRFRQRELTQLLDAHASFAKRRRAAQDPNDPHCGYGRLRMNIELLRASLDWYLEQRDGVLGYCTVVPPSWESAQGWQRKRTGMDDWFVRRYVTTSGEYELTEKLRSEFMNAGFLAGLSLPVILISEEMPHVPDVITVDACGVYEARTKTIVLYDRMLWRASLILGVSIEECRKIVLIHEMGHWFTHAFPHWRVRAWPLVHFGNTAGGVVEGLAELLTYWTVLDSPPLLQLFLQWNAVSPPQYQTWQEFQHHPHPAVIDAVLKMRQLCRPTLLQDMRTLLP